MPGKLQCKIRQLIRIVSNFINFNNNYFKIFSQSFRDPELETRSICGYPLPLHFFHFFFLYRPPTIQVITVSVFTRHVT